MIIDGLQNATPGNKVEPHESKSEKTCKMISKFFIERPVLANVIALFLVLLGLVAIVVLPVTQYPAIVPPTIQVTPVIPAQMLKP